MKNTRIISAFPGTGKSYIANNTDMDVLDSDSSKFSKLEDGSRNIKFPENYIHHIKSQIGKVDLILVSTHEEVRNALIDEGIVFDLAYPAINLFEEYESRYIERGSPEWLIKIITDNWFVWISDLLQIREVENHIILESGEFLSDKIN